MKILFLVPYPQQQAASQRFRFEQYFSILEHEGHSFRVQSFLQSRNWNYFFKAGHFPSKMLMLASGFLRRFLVLFLAPRYNMIFIHREATPIGPPIIEWVLAKLLKKKIIYDFDDAIWLTDRSNESKLLRGVKWRSKVSAICKWSWKVSAGNAYLASFASRYNRSVVINPTTIDLNYHQPKQNINKLSSIVIGWTGSHSTVKYLTDIEQALKRLESEFAELEFHVIADQKPLLHLQRMVFIPWSLSSEIEALHSFDIGVMPLPDDEWAKGKCGFKALQYMSMGIPTIASPVGVNTSIIQSGVNGLLASGPEEWYECLRKLLIDPAARKRMGFEGQKTVSAHYSVTANTGNFLSLFE